MAPPPPIACGQRATPGFALPSRTSRASRKLIFGRFLIFLFFLSFAFAYLFLNTRFLSSFLSTPQNSLLIVVAFHYEVKLALHSNSLVFWYFPYSYWNWSIYFLVKNLASLRFRKISVPFLTIKNIKYVCINGNEFISK